MKKRFLATSVALYLTLAAFSPVVFATGESVVSVGGTTPPVTNTPPATPPATGTPPAAPTDRSATTSPCAPTDAEIASSSVKEMLAKCQPKNVIVSSSGDYKIEEGARKKVTDIANQIILVGSILSVGALVYAAILYTIAAGDDERIKKAKGSLKFGIIGFVMMLLSFPLVNAIIRLFYSTAG